MLRQTSTVVSMPKAGRGPAVVPLSVEEEAFLRAWSRAALTVPRALDADLLAGQGMSLSGMSRIVSRLEAQGLVQRERASCDGRGLNAVLTDAGLGRLRRAWPTHLASVRRQMMDHLSELDLPAVTAALQRFASDPPDTDPQQEVRLDISPSNA